MANAYEGAEVLKLGRIGQSRLADMLTEPVQKNQPPAPRTNQRRGRRGRSK